MNSKNTKVKKNKSIIKLKLKKELERRIDEEYEWNDDRL